MKPSDDFLTTVIEYLKLEKFKYNSNTDCYYKDLNKLYSVCVEFFNNNGAYDFCIITVENELGEEVYNDSDNILSLKDLKKEIKALSKYYTLKKYRFIYETEAIDKMDFHLKCEEELKYISHRKITLVK